MEHVQWVLRFLSYMFVMFIFWIFSLPKWRSETPFLSCSAVWLETAITGCNVLLLKSGSQFHQMDTDVTWKTQTILVQDFSAKYMFFVEEVVGGSICPGPKLTETENKCTNFFSGTFQVSIIPVAAVPLGSHSKLWCISVAACNIETCNQQLKRKISRFLWGSLSACLGWGMVTTYLRLWDVILGGCVKGSHIFSL